MASIPGALLLVLRDPSCLGTCFLAVIIAHVSARRASEIAIRNDEHKESGHRDEEAHPESTSASALSDGTIAGPPAAISGSTAIWVPVLASGTLLCIYFFKRAFEIIVLFLSVGCGMVSLSFALWPAAHFVVTSILHRRQSDNSVAPGAVGNNRRGRHEGLSLSGLPREDTRGQRLSDAVAVTAAVFINLAWLISGHWILNDIIAFANCVLFASIFRIESLKTATILLSGFFLYDVFFVFFSERFFGQNVMGTVATSTAENPVAALSESLNLPIAVAKDISPPVKLIVPVFGASKDGQRAFSILGLGDIVLPSALLALLCEFQHKCSSTRGERRRTPILYAPALVAYGVSLVLAFTFNIAYSALQPALMYIVPAVLATTILTARAQNVFPDLWNGEAISAEVGDDEEAKPLADGSSTLDVVPQEM